MQSVLFAFEQVQVARRAPAGVRQHLANQAAARMRDDVQDGVGRSLEERQGVRDRAHTKRSMI